MTLTRKRRLAGLGRARHSFAGFTLIEMMVVIGLVGVLIALAAPSMRGILEVRRLRAINSQLVTDLQFARSEAISRRSTVRLDFRESASETCYTISTSQSSAAGFMCNCLNGPGQACPAGSNADGTETAELRTVSIPRSLGTQLTFVRQEHRRFGFEPTLGGLVTTPIDLRPIPLPEAWIEPAIDSRRKYRIQLIQTGRPLMCTPAGSTMDAAACPP